MLDVFKLAQAVNEGAAYGGFMGDYESVDLRGMSIEEACGEVNYIIACESADICEFYANSTNILIEAAMTGDQERVQYINEASAKEVKNKVAAFFKKIIGAVKAFFQKIVTAIKNMFAKIKAWFKSKKKNKAGKEDTVENHVKNMKEDIKEPATEPPEMTSWNDAYIDERINDGIENKIKLVGIDELHTLLANAAATLNSGTNLQSDPEIRAGMASNASNRMDEVIGNVNADSKEIMDGIMDNIRNGRQKDPRKHSDVRQMISILAEEPDVKFAKSEKEMTKYLTDMEKSIMSSVEKNSARAEGDAVSQKFINDVQRGISVITTNVNRLVTALSTAVRGRTAEYQRAIDWAVANSGKLGGSSMA